MILSNTSREGCGITDKACTIPAVFYPCLPHPPRKRRTNPHSYSIGHCMILHPNFRVKKNFHRMSFFVQKPHDFAMRFKAAHCSRVFVSLVESAAFFSLYCCKDENYAKKKWQAAPNRQILIMCPLPHRKQSTKPIENCRRYDSKFSADISCADCYDSCNEQQERQKPPCQSSVLQNSMRSCKI